METFQTILIKYQYEVNKFILVEAFLLCVNQGKLLNSLEFTWNKQKKKGGGLATRTLESYK